MKNTFKIFVTAGCAALMMLAACKKNDPEAVATSGKAGALSVNSTTVVLDKSKLNDTTSAVRFTYTKANYGYNAAITTNLQIDVDGDNWANPSSITLTANATAQGFSTNDFNNLLLKLSLTGGKSAKINVRLQQSISTAIAPIYSNVVSMTVTPFNLTTFVYTVGAFQGWNINAEDSLISVTGNGIYTGIVGPHAVGDGNDQFLITPTKGSFSNKYATTDPTTAPSKTVTVNGSNNFVMASAPSDDAAVNITTNLVTLNTGNNTISFTPTQWAIVGDATPGGWPNASGPQSDTDLKYNNGTQLWYITVKLTAGNLKFRLNHDWGTNLGGTGDGTLTSGGGNIPIAAAGTYMITLNTAASTYTLVKQ